MTTESTASASPSVDEQALGEAVNMVGQTLYAALGQGIQQLPEEMRNREIILQGIASFVANIIHQQAPNDPEISHDMMAQIHKISTMHLNALSPVS